MQVKSTTLFGERKVIFKETSRSVTPFGGLWFFFEHLKLTGFREEAEKHMPFRLTSRNAIRPVETLTSFLTSVPAGARRFSHTAVIRSDDALHAMMGVERFPTLNTVLTWIRQSLRGMGAKRVRRKGSIRGSPDKPRTIPFWPYLRKGASFCTDGSGAGIPACRVMWWSS